MKKSESEVKENEGVSLPKLTLKPTKNLHRTGNNSFESPSYDFYLENKNVTPEPLDSVKYSRIENEDSSSFTLEGKINFIKEISNSKSEEYGINYFLQGSAEAAKTLLEDVFSKQTHENNEQIKYDPGPDWINKQETIEIGSEIELSESDTIFLLQLRGSVVVEGYLLILILNV